MKSLKIIFNSTALLALWAGSTPTASASTFFTDFTGYGIGDINGVNGWTVNSTTADVGYVQSAPGPFGGRAASIGFASPVTASNLYVSQGTDAALVGGPTAISFSSLFQIIDSDSGFGPGAAVRDSFGFRLENAANQNVFSFHLNPFSQSVTPESGTNAFHTFAWSSDYANGGTQSVALPGIAAEETFAYTFSVGFFDAGAGNVGFLADVNGSTFGGTLVGAAGVSIAEFGAIWNTVDTTGPIEPGSNFMLFDNVTFVPEPSSALLGVLGASLLLRRRRCN